MGRDTVMTIVAIGILAAGMILGTYIGWQALAEAVQLFKVPAVNQSAIGCLVLGLFLILVGNGQMGFSIYWLVKPVKESTSAY